MAEDQNKKPEDVITFQGILKPDGTRVPWGHFVTMKPEEQAGVMGSAGLTDEEQQQLTADLMKTHGVAYNQPSGPGEGILPKIINTLHFGMGGGDQPTKERSWQNKDIAGLVSNVNKEALTRKESGVTPQQPAPQQTPQFSEANLQAYLKDFVQPILNERTQATQSEWGNIAQQMGKYGGNKFPGFEGMKATATDMVRDSMISAMMGPYLQQANTAMGGAFNQGAGIAASAYSMQPIIQALSNPQVAAMFGQTSGGGNLLGGMGGSSIGNLNNMNSINSLLNPQQQQKTTP